MLNFCSIFFPKCISWRWKKIGDNFFDIITFQLKTINIVYDILNIFLEIKGLCTLLLSLSVMQVKIIWTIH